MLDMNINDYNQDNNDDAEIARLVEIARENGIEGDDSTLYKFVKMAYSIGADMYALDAVAPEYNILDEPDFQLGVLAGEDGLSDDQFEDLCNYLDAHVDNARATKQNVGIAKDTIADAVGYHKNYGSDEKNLDVAIAEQMYYDFCKENGIG